MTEKKLPKKKINYIYDLTSSLKNKIKNYLKNTAKNRLLLKEISLSVNHQHVVKNKNW